MEPPATSRPPTTHRLSLAEDWRECAWMTASDPNVAANWEAIGYTTRASQTVTELESYKSYWFCVSAIGSAGEGLQSDPAIGRAA